MKPDVRRICVFRCKSRLEYTSENDSKTSETVTLIAGKMLGAFPFDVEGHGKVEGTQTCNRTYLFLKFVERAQNDRTLGTRYLQARPHVGTFIERCVCTRVHNGLFNPLNSEQWPAAKFIREIASILRQQRKASTATRVSDNSFAS